MSKGIIGPQNVAGAVTVRVNETLGKLEQFNASGLVTIDMKSEIMNAILTERLISTYSDVADLVLVTLACLVAARIKSVAARKDRLENEIMEDVGVIALSKHGKRVAEFRDEMRSLRADYA